MLHIGRPLYWDVAEDGIVECARSEIGDATVVSFDQFDHRMRCPRPLTTQAAKRALIREQGEQTRVVNRSWSRQLVYARPTTQVQAVGLRVVPGLSCLDTVLAASGRQSSSCIAGFVLGAEAPGARRIALLYAFDESGEVVRFQPAINPDSVESVAAELARASNTDAASAGPYLFSQQDLLAASVGAAAYPVEPEWNGIPIRRLQAILAGLLCAAALGATTGNLYSFYEGLRDGRRFDETTRATRTVVASNEARLASVLPAFSREVSLPYAELVEDAQGVWMPGGRVTLASDQDRDELSLIFALGGSDFGAGGDPRLRRRPVRTEDLIAALGISPPRGFSLKDHSANGDGNAIRIRFERTRPDRGLERLARR